MNITNVWLLLYISAGPNMEIITEQKQIFDFGPTCEQAAKGRQLFIEPIGETKYVCVKVPRKSDADGQ
jgi:hypothetical protein